MQSTRIKAGQAFPTPKFTFNCGRRLTLPTTHSTGTPNFCFSTYVHNPRIAAAAAAAAAATAPSPYVYVFAALGMGKTTADVLGYKPPTAMSGYQHVQAGGKLQDDTLNILMDKERGEMAIPPHARCAFIAQHKKLNLHRKALEATTESYSGSFRKWNEARRFHNEALRLQKKTRYTSDAGISMKLEALAHKQLLETHYESGPDYGNAIQEDPARVVEVAETLGCTTQAFLPNTYHNSGQNCYSHDLHDRNWTDIPAVGNHLSIQLEYPAYPPPSKSPSHR